MNTRSILSSVVVFIAFSLISACANDDDPVKVTKPAASGGTTANGASSTSGGSSSKSGTDSIGGTSDTGDTTSTET